MVFRAHMGALGAGWRRPISGDGRKRLQRTNLGASCATSVATIYHEFGHALALHHEHQRADRDSYLVVDVSGMTPDLRQWYQKYNYPLVGPYDLLSIMHYGLSAGMTVQPQYQSLAKAYNVQTACQSPAGRTSLALPPGSSTSTWLNASTASRPTARGPSWRTPFAIPASGAASISRG